MENAFARYEGISACWIEKCTFISGIVAMALDSQLCGDVDFGAGAWPGWLIGRITGLIESITAGCSDGRPLAVVGKEGVVSEDHLLRVRGCL